MYGIVNQAVKGLVKENFGEESWQKIVAASGIESDIFLSNESYDDSTTYQLAGAAAEVLEISVPQVLQALGEYWILRTGLSNYGELLKSGGGNLREFIINLPNFHSRVMLMYPKVTPPEFKVTDETERSVNLHYYSTREGLADFVVGLIHGLGKLFETPVEVKLLESRAEGSDHEVFQVNW